MSWLTPLVKRMTCVPPLTFYVGCNRISASLASAGAQRDSAMGYDVPEGPGISGWNLRGRRRRRARQEGGAGLDPASAPELRRRENQRQRRPKRLGSYALGRAIASRRNHVGPRGLLCGLSLEPRVQATLPHDCPRLHGPDGGVGGDRSAGGASTKSRADADSHSTLCSKIAHLGDVPGGRLLARSPLRSGPRPGRRIRRQRPSFRGRSSGRPSRGFIALPAPPVRGWLHAG
jgi:hypothetical protein